MKKFVVTVLVLLLIAGIGLGAFFYFGSYSEGTRAGTVVKVSKRGTFFKTYEGQLNMESFGAVSSSKQLNEIFEFSIPKDNDSIFKLLQEVALSGERVNVRYHEKYISVPWRGDTKYFVDGIDRLDTKSESKKAKDRLFE